MFFSSWLISRIIVEYLLATDLPKHLYVRVKALTMIYKECYYHIP